MLGLRRDSSNNILAWGSVSWIFVNYKVSQPVVFHPSWCPPGMVNLTIPP